MCQRKPGRRCPSHARAALAAAQRRYDEAVKRVETAQGDQSQTPPSRVKVAQQRLAAAEGNLVAARADKDSTVDGRDALLNALADDSLPKEKRERLSARFQHAEALTKARATQRQFMPDLPAERTADMARTFTTLGESRDSLARVDAELSVAVGEKDRRRLTDQRDVLSERVFTHDVQYRLAATGWRPDPAHVSPDEQRAVRAGGMEAQRSLVVLSHQRAAASSGGHGDRFQRAVADAEGAFQRRYLPERTPASTTAPNARQDRGARPARAGGRGPTRRRKPVLSSTEAAMLLRRAGQVGKGDKVTPGKHQGDPILPDLA